MSRLQELIAELCPDGVEYKNLGDVADIKAGSGFPKQYQGVSVGELLFCKVGDMNRPGNETFMLTSENYIGYETAKLLKCYIAPAGSILFPKIGAAIATNKKRITVQETCFDNNVFALVPKDESISKYLFYVFGAVDLMSLVLGEGAVPSIRKGAVESIRIPFPPIEVQREVVRILDEYTAAHDELVRQLEEEMALREQELSTARNDLLSFESDVQWSTLGEIMTIERGASPRPIKKFVTNSEDGVPWIKIGDVDTGGKYITSTAEHITQAGAEKSRLLSAGSFVLSNSMSYGRPYILKIDGCIHDGWLSLREYDDVYDTDFLYYLLRSDLVQHYWDSKVNSSSVSNLNSDLVKKTPVPIPPIEKQRQIASTLDLMAEPFAQIIETLGEQLTLENAQLALVRNQLLSFPEKVA